MCYSDLSSLAQEAAVSLGVKDVARSANSTASVTGPPDTKQSFSSEAQQDEINGVEIERRSLRQLDLSDGVVGTLLQS